MISVYKLDEHGTQVWHYDGELLYRDAECVKLQAYFNRDDYAADYHTFRRGDRMVEWFYSQRWYNTFQIHDVDDDRLMGWYCNITRPARLDAEAVYAEDLALDVMVYPDGRYLVLDEDEFAALDIDDQTRQKALQALEDLRALIEARKDVFAAITP